MKEERSEQKLTEWQRELREQFPRINSPQAAERLWTRVFSDAERKRLGGDLEKAYAGHGSVGMWGRVRGGSINRAIADIARALGFMTPEIHEWVLRESGESKPDIELSIQSAIESKVVLVLGERPRCAYYTGEEITIQWDKDTALWEFLWDLAVAAKRGRTVDSTQYSEKPGNSAAVNRKSRLIGHESFPQGLAKLIKSCGRGTYRLDIEPKLIEVFLVESYERVEKLTV